MTGKKGLAVALVLEPTPLPNSSTLDDSGNHHMMLRANGNRVLISASGKGNDVFPEFRKRDDLVHIAAICAVDRSGLVVVFLCQGIHLVYDRLKRTPGVLLLDQPPRK